MPPGSVTQRTVERRVMARPDERALALRMPVRTTGGQGLRSQRRMPTWLSRR